MKASEQANILFPYLLPKIEKIVRGVTVASSGSGSGGTGGAPSPHALSSVHHTGTLADAQAPQFLLMNGSRDLTGNLAVDVGITIDGVDLSAHVIDPDAHHDHATVGNTGLSITGQQISANLATSSGLAIASGLKVDVTHNFTWTGTHQFNVDPQVSANLDFIGGDRVITASSDLTFTPVDDLILTSTKTFRSSDYADGIPIAGYSLFINSGGNRQLTINTIKSDELHTRLFVADTVRIDIGEEYWGKSMGIVHDDFTTPASIGGTVTVKFEDSPLITGQLFSSGDWILIRYLDDSTGFAFGSIWGQVTSYTDLGNDSEGRGHQSWTFTLRSGATSQLIKKANIAVDFGVSGQGYVHLSTLDSADGPWIRIGEWSGANPYAAGNNSIGTQIGLLDGISDTDLNPAGYGLYSDNAYLKGMLRTIQTVLDDDGVTMAHPTVTGSADFDDDDARISWWADLDDRSGDPRAQIASWRYELSDPISVNMLQLLVTDEDFADFGMVRLAALGSLGGAIFSLSSLGEIVLTGTSSFEGHAVPSADGTYDLGTASKHWRTLYVDLLDADTISGTSLSGQTWTYPASMTVDAVSASTTLVSIANSGAGRADLDVDRNITLGGTIDGVDLAAHVVDASAHHNPVTAGNTGISLSTQAVSLALNATASGLQISSGLMLDDAIAGAGLTIASKVLAVGAGNGITVNANDVALASGTAGAGLTYTTGVLAVGAGNGITVNANDVALASSAAGAGLTYATGVLAVGAGNGITVNADDVALASSAAGAGLTYTTGVLAVGAATGITVAADTVAVDQAFSPTWTGTHQFNVDIQLNADLDFLGARTITSNSTNNLTMAPGGDLVLNPTGADVLPGGSIAIDLGDYNRKWRTLYAAELYVETLVAQDVMATIGGRVMVAPTTTLIADLTNVATTIDVKHNFLASGDYVMLQTAPAGVAQFEALKVTSGATVITGGYRYTVTRNQDGTGANSWVSGDAVVSLGGAVGEGYIDLTSTSTVHGHSGPTITIYSRTSTASWNGTKPVVTIGNLASFVDYSSDTFGTAAGNDLTLDVATGFSGYTIDATDGLRLFNTLMHWKDGTGEWIAGIDGGSLLFGSAATLSPSTAVLTLSGAGIFANTAINGDVQVTGGAIIPGSGGIDWRAGVGVTAVMTADSSGIVISDGGISVDGFIRPGGSAQTISGGVITATTTQTTVDTQAAAATDDLDTINGGTTGDIIIIHTINSAHDVVIRDGVGNISCPANRTLSHVDDMWMGMYNGARWVEISYADNA